MQENRTGVRVVRAFGQEARELRRLNAQIASDFNEEITGGKTIKALHIEQKMLSFFLKDTEKMKQSAIHASRIRGLFTGIVDFRSSFALAVVLWKGGILAQDQVGTFSLFMSYTQGMMEPLRWMIESVSDLVSARGLIEKLEHGLDTNVGEGGDPWRSRSDHRRLLRPGGLCGSRPTTGPGRN